MLVDLHATTLTSIKPVVDLAAFLSRRGNSIRIPGNTRDEDTIIDYCSAALRKYNPDSRPVDYEVVYQVNDDFTIMGVLHEGSLIKAYDSSAICDQFHIDNTMAIFVHHKKILSMKDRHDNMMVFIPNNLQYDENYYRPKIFAEFLKDESISPDFNKGDKRQLDYLITLIHQSCDIVRVPDKLTPNEVDHINALLNAYGAYIHGHNFNDYVVPEKYVISKKWMDKVRIEIGSNPYFVFRHIWRCYFRLCKEGYRFNA